MVAKQVRVLLYVLILAQKQVLTKGFVTSRTSSSLLVRPRIRLHDVQQKIMASNVKDETSIQNIVKEEILAPRSNIAIPIDSTETSLVSSDIKKNAGLELWKKRLITHEDSFNLHKLASISYTISSAVMLINAAIGLSTSPEAFSNIPTVMELFMNIFTVSNIVMCFASVRMAFIHRQGDLIARNAFLGTAVSSLFSGFYMVWISPFSEGDIFNSLWISRMFFAVLVGLNAFFIADTILRTDEIVEGRRDRKAADYTGRKIIDTLGYVFPVAWGMPLIAATGWNSCVIHDRSWFIEQCLFIDSQLHYPGFQSHVFYQQLSTSLAASYASLFVTLRDKKLISKTVELGGITIFAMPALIWSIYTTVTFIRFLSMPH